MPKDKKITPEKASAYTLACQLSAQSLAFGIRNDEELLQAATCDFDTRASAEENLRRIITANQELQWHYKNAYLILDTDKVCLLPSELYHPTSAAAYMQANGITLTPDEEIIGTEPAKGVVALIAFQQSALDCIRELHGGALRVLHPLQVAILKNHTHPTLEVNLTNDLSNIVISNSKLQYSEVLPCREPVDALFFLQQLDQLYDLREYDLLITGEGAQEVQKFVRPYYRQAGIDKALYSRTPKSLRAEILNYNNLIYTLHADH